MACYLKYLLIMELRFDAILYSTLGNENFDAGHIKCLRGTQVPTPGPQELDRQSQPVSGNTVQQVEKLNYLGMVFTSDGRWSEEIATRIGKANAALRELSRSVVTKRELSNTAKLQSLTAPQSL